MFEMLKFMNALNIKIWVKTESETIFAIRSHYNIINTKYITCVCVCVCSAYKIIHLFFHVLCCSLMLNSFELRSPTSIYTPYTIMTKQNRTVRTSYIYKKKKKN